MTRQRVEDMCDVIYKTFPKNVTIFIVQSNQPSKIECIYSGNFYDIKNNNIINHIENMIDGSSDLNELKVKIREFYIDKIIHEEKKI